MSLIQHENWELTLLDAAAPVRPVEGLFSLAVGDIDGDGHVEIITGGWGALMWYRPATAERGVAYPDGCFGVGAVLHDVDGDGLSEIAVGYTPSDITYTPQDSWKLAWLKPPGRLATGGRQQAAWKMHIIESDVRGHPHDLLFADVDGDGRAELISNYVQGRQSGLRAYKPGDDPAQPWRKHTVQHGHLEEGLAVSDFDGDGRIEIASGVSLYRAPAGGAFAGPWERQIVAPSHREMCRVAAVDITGNGRDDLVIVDSEYLEGQISWFENRMSMDDRRKGSGEWVEHPLERGIYYGHSLFAQRLNGQVRIVLGEMAGGGWKAPYNYDARIIEYLSSDNGAQWQRRILYQGAGTHEATVVDIDGDGEEEVVGKEWRIPKVQIYKKAAQVSPLLRFRHQFIDRDKPEVATDILPVDVDGDGLMEVVCGSWWYRRPAGGGKVLRSAQVAAGDWERYGIPGVAQVINAYDIDGDGKMELIAIKRSEGKHGYAGLSSDLVWLKAIDPERGKWEQHEIGSGTGDWPHGSLVAPLLPGGKLALVTAYHSAHAKAAEGNTDYPDLWMVPDDPARGRWERRPLAKILHGEELAGHDIDGDGVLDIVAGAWWLKNNGDGTFTPHRMIEDFYAARLAVADLSGNGRADVVLGEEVLDFQKRVTPFSRLLWCERGDDPAAPWTPHVIDTVRCAHSLAAADLDGDGEIEVICGEHDPFYICRSRSHLFVYKKADPAGRAWKRYALDDRFEHHDGCKIIDLGDGRKGIISHGWQDSIYVHLWAQED